MYATLISAFCICFAIIGCAYTVAAGLAVRSFGKRRPDGASPNAPSVTILKPLKGAEPRLYESLATFVEQDYPGPVQIVFGVSDAHDSACGVVEQLIRAYPERDIVLVVGHRPVAGNAKIANLVSMAPAIRNDVVVLSDSDIAVTPRYLSDICDALGEPDVGLVTCLYRGDAGRGLWSHLSAMAVDFHFFPSVLVGTRLAKARPCFGATIALSTDTLEKIGGFATFALHLADDYAIGEAVRATGRRVALSRHIVAHRCNERSWRELFFHELRWARTIRSIDPVGFSGSLVTHPLPFAGVALACGGAPMAALGCLAFTIACRASLQWQVERVFGRRSNRWILGPFRDAISLLVFVASFATDVVEWRGRRYRVRADGTMEEIEVAARKAWAISRRAAPRPQTRSTDPEMLR